MVEFFSDLGNHGQKKWSKLCREISADKKSHKTDKNISVPYLIPSSLMPFQIDLQIHLFEQVK